MRKLRSSRARSLVSVASAMLAFFSATGAGAQLPDFSELVAEGIEAGDLVLRVNNTPIRSVKHFHELLATLDGKRPVALLIRDQHGTRFITLRPDED